MNNEKSMAVHIPWDLNKIPSFDFMKFTQVVEQAEGRGQTLKMSLEGKKTWFRLACPTGGLALNALRVTDTMAIFEARVFADVEDRNPLASFTATQTADKAKDTAYIRTAQDAALDEALERAGFSLQTWSMSPREPAPDANGAVNAGKPTTAPPEENKTPPVAVPQQADESVVKTAEKAQAVQTAPKAAPTAPQFKSVTDTAPRPAPVGPPPHAPGVLTASAGGAQIRSDTGSKPASASVVDISTAKPAEKVQPVGQQEQAGVAAQATAESASTQEAPAPVTYTPDMTVEEICERMTLEQAKKLKVLEGTCKGWTLEQVAADRPPSLKWLRYTAPSADNVLKAGAAIMLKELELKQAG